MIFSREGYRGRAYRDYLRLLNLTAAERYKLDEMLKARLKNLGFDMTKFYPSAGGITFDDVTVYSFDQDTGWSFDVA